MHRPAVVVLLAGAMLAAACASGPSGGSAAGIAWKGASGVGGLGGGTVYDVSANGSGFVAVGTFPVDGHTYGGVWLSPDGDDWSAGFDVGLHDMAVLRVIQGGPGLVALVVDCQPGAGECANASIWTSVNGAAWTMATRLDKCCTPAALGRSPLGIAAVGVDYSTGFPAKPADAAAFVSADGITWTRSATDASFTAATMGAVVAAGPGWVALGDAQAGPVAWTSRDGRSWAAVPSPPAPGTARIRDAAVAGGRIVAVGSDAGQAASWTSSDGMTWTKAPAADALKSGQMNRVAAAGSSLLAAGKNAAGSAVWASPEGSTWTVSATSKSAEAFHLVAANGNRAVAMGLSPDGTLVVLVGTLASG